MRLNRALEPRLLSDGEGLELKVMDLGATWLSCRVPLADGAPRDVLLDCAPGPQRPGYMGSTVGRYANRIAEGMLTRAGSQWRLVRAPGERHQLHGGPGGFHVRTFEIESLQQNRICWALRSHSGDQGFPGALTVQLEVSLPGGRTIDWRCTAQVTQASPVAVTNHAYFNLGGDKSVLGHRLQIAAHYFAPIDSDLIPLAHLRPISGTDFDFGILRVLSERWLTSEQTRLAGGYDHAFLLDPKCGDAREPAALLWSADGRLGLSISTNAPALQVYTGQHLGGIADARGEPLPPSAGIALEPGFLPNSPNRSDWPQASCWLEPGQIYEHRIRYRFIDSMGLDNRCHSAPDSESASEPSLP
jgi:aldose 1-epimerase